MKTTCTLNHAAGRILAIWLFFSATTAFSQAVPEYMYYKFDAPGDQQNYASAPVGNNPATLSGLIVGSSGEFGTAVVGNGSSSSSNCLNTGWATSLPSTGWTISFWVNNFPGTSSTTFYYFGDNTAGSFRCFTGGVAGDGNLMLRGTGLTDVPINSIPSTPTVIHLVYTGSAVKIYFNGVYSSEVAQSAVTFTGTGPFKVAGYSSSNCMNSGTLMDEFRLYNRALTDTEISLTWNQQLPVITAGPPVAVTGSATSVTGTTATLNGTVDANEDATTVTFEYGLTTAYGTTVAGVPPTVTGTTATPVTAALTGLLPGNTYHYRIKGVNAYGTSTGSDSVFTTPPALPTAVTTTATAITATTATINGLVNASGASSAISFEYGLTTSYGTTVPGTPSPVTGNTDTPVSANITGLTVNNTYHYRVIATNTVGTTNGNDLTFYSSDCPLPGTPGPISGTDTACANSQGNIYTVAPVPFAVSYVWTVPAGAVITSGSTTNTITVTMGTTPGNITVYGVDSCGNGPTASLPVAIIPAPVPTISGQSSMCVNSGNYYYTTEAGMTGYQWTVSAGGAITWGQGTNVIKVSWNSAGAQSVSVNYTGPSGCQAGTPTVLAVDVNPVPGPAGTITGTAAVCGGAAGVVYSVAPVLDATAYVWTVPAGAAIVSGEWTNAITVDFAGDAASGDITVYGNNICGNGTLSPAFPVTVTPLPADAGNITGVSPVCAGASGVSYSVAEIAYATGYNWTLPAGATIASGANTHSILVDFDLTAVSGVITVAGTNSCGDGAVSPDFPLTVNPAPASPVITLNGDTLLSDAPQGNQWYLNGTVIPGATSQVLVPEQSGTYTCIVTLNGCPSPVSNEIIVIMTGLNGKKIKPVIEIFPNPCDEMFTVQVSSGLSGKADLTVMNYLGVTVFEERGISVTGTTEHTIILKNAPAGIYMVMFKSNDYTVVKKVVIR